MPCWDLQNTGLACIFLGTFYLPAFTSPLVLVQSAGSSNVSTLSTNLLKYIRGEACSNYWIIEMHASYLKTQAKTCFLLDGAKPIDKNDLHSINFCFTSQSICHPSVGQKQGSRFQAIICYHYRSHLISPFTQKSVCDLSSKCSLSSWGMLSSGLSLWIFTSFPSLLDHFRGQICLR